MKYVTADFDIPDEIVQAAKDRTLINKCLHRSCTQCNGTGRKKDGTLCVHMISCPCPSCSPARM